MKPLRAFHQGRLPKATLFNLIVALALLIGIISTIALANPADYDTAQPIPSDIRDSLASYPNVDENELTLYEDAGEFTDDYITDDTESDDSDVIPIDPTILDEMMNTSLADISNFDLHDDEKTRCENLRDVLLNKGNFTELIHDRFTMSYKTTPHIPYSGVYRRLFGVKRFVHKFVHSTDIDKADLRVMSVDPIVGLCVLESTLDMRSRRTNHTESDVKHVLVFKSWGKKYAGARIYDYNPDAFMKMIMLYTTAAERSAWKLAAAIYKKGYTSRAVRRMIDDNFELKMDAVGYSRHGSQTFKGRKGLQKAADWAVKYLWGPHIKPRPKAENYGDWYHNDDDGDSDHDFDYSYDHLRSGNSLRSRYNPLYIADSESMSELTEYDDDMDSGYGDDYGYDNDHHRRRRRRHHHHHKHDLGKLLKYMFPLALPFTAHWCDVHYSNSTHIEGSCFMPPLTSYHKKVLSPRMMGKVYLNAPQVRFTMEFTRCGYLYRLHYTPLQPNSIHGYWNHDKEDDDDDSSDKNYDHDNFRPESSENENDNT